MDKSTAAREESLGTTVRKYVARKFGEHEAGQVILSHDSLRYIIANFTIEWINTREAEEEKTDAN